VQCIAISVVCLYVCLFVCPLACLKNHKFSLHVTRGRGSSSTDGSAIRYVLPVLWVTSHVFIWCRKYMPESKTTRMFRPVYKVAAPRATSAVCDCILFFKSECMNKWPFTMDPLSSLRVLDPGSIGNPSLQWRSSWAPCVGWQHES